MLERINRICFEHIHRLALLTNSAAAIDCGVNDESFSFQIAGDDGDNGEQYEIIVDEYDIHPEDESDKDTPFGKRENVTSLSSDSDHFDFLGACLDALSQSDLKIVNVSTDGDNKDCEAIFRVDDEEYGYVVVKIR